MIAAIYARKSTEQNGVADEAKSVARQMNHAKRSIGQDGAAFRLYLLGGSSDDAEGSINYAA